MGKDSQGTEASSSGSENYGLDSCEAHHVGVSKTEDRSRSKGKMGEVESRQMSGKDTLVETDKRRQSD
jgi:hypothetical protein